jgi:hypothetical protein
MATITVRQASRLGNYKRPWVARVTGRDGQFGLRREFLSPATTEHGGTWTFEVGDGLYEYADRNSKGAERRYFALVSGGVLQDAVPDESVTEYLAHLEVLAASAPAAPAPLPESEWHECLECGWRTPDPWRIDAGGMGCQRCNH